MIEYIDLTIDFTKRNDRINGITLDRVTTRSYDTAIKFRIEIVGHVLDETYGVKILTKYHKSGLSVMTTLGGRLEIADGKLIYTPKVNLITEADYVRNYLYLSKDGLGLDMAQFNYQVDVSQIGEVAVEVRQVYDESYEALIAEFEQALEDYKLTLPQADSVRAEIDVILNQFGVDSQQVIGDLVEVSATAEIAEASRGQAESERVQAETERKEAEILRQESYDAKVDTAIVEADVVGKVDNKVTELTPQINNLTAQLAQTAAVLEDNKKRIEIEVNEETATGNVLHVFPNAGSNARAIEVHNRSGITDGSMTDRTKARESLVIHHYNDNNVVQIDNVGRDNTIMVLKQGKNPTMASHSEIGRGSYIEFDRAGADLPTPLVVEHLGRISGEDWWDVGMLAAEHTWGLTLVGKRDSGNKAQTVLPVLIYSKGLSGSAKGADALRIHSTDYGGTGLRITNRPTSDGSLLSLEGTSNVSGKPFLNINMSGANSAIAIYNNGKTNAVMSFSRANAIFGDLIRATNESGATIFRIEGDGLAIHLKDSATGELKRLAISNGSVVVQ